MPVLQAILTTLLFEAWRFFHRAVMNESAR